MPKGMENLLPLMAENPFRCCEMNEMIVVFSFICISILLIAVSGRNARLRNSILVATALLTVVSVVSLLPGVLRGDVLRVDIAPLLPGAHLCLRVDAMGLLFALVASFLWLITIFYAIGYMNALEEHAQTRFFIYFTLSIFCALGVAFSANFLTLYLFYELLSLCTYPLVVHDQTPEAYAAGKKYLVYLLGTSIFFLCPAIILTYFSAGTLDFADSIQKGVFHGGVQPAIVITCYVLCVLGFAKAAIMPFHGWLPSAMVAPTPVSALLHAVAVVKVGVFSLSRVMLYIFGLDILQRFHLNIYTGIFVSCTILLASLIALTKDNLKARLAYSTVSQLSYIILGVSLLTPDGVCGGLLHIANHAVSKITLFFCAGIIFVASRKKNISEMTGLGREMPLTFFIFALAALSMIGAPPTAGFITKWYLMLGTMTAGEYVFFIVLAVSSLLNIGYFMPIVFRALFVSPDGANSSLVRKVPLTMLLPIVVTSILILTLGMYPDFLLRLVKLVR